MKKNMKILSGAFWLFVMMFSISSCSDDADIILFSGSQPITETGTCTNLIYSINLYLNGGQSQDIGIANGKGGYSAQSSDETIVTAVVKDSRLLITSHDKKGKAVVTVSDKKGNRKELPVSVSNGIFPFYLDRQDVVVLVDENPSEDEELKSQIKQAMSAYPFANMQEHDCLIFFPDDVTKMMTLDGSGTFALRANNGSGETRLEGSYQVELDDAFTGSEEITFVLHFNGESHSLFLDPKRLNETRNPGPLRVNFYEDITSLYQEASTPLPANTQIVNIITMAAPRMIQPEK